MRLLHLLPLGQIARVLPPFSVERGGEAFLIFGDLPDDTCSVDG
ncbi:hypothetical protein [Neorhodopirellula pilleata]|nr:hypothetical protein [Neorhodopirellula pilleata]